MNFVKDYPSLFQFFAGYFSDSDFEELSDEEIVINYKNKLIGWVKCKENMEELNKELIDLMRNIEYYREEVSEESNRYFETPADALIWLEMIRKNLAV